MRNRGLRFVLTLLLSAAVLLGAVTPPAVQHAHADGDRSHDHRVAVADENSPAHRHPHAHPHRHPHGPESERPTQARSRQVPTPHWHLTLFGWEVCLPCGGSQNGPDDGPGTGGDESATWVRWVDAEVVSASNPAVDRLFAGLPALVEVATDTVAYTRLLDGRAGLSSPPLCDSARGERSGVQLV